MPQDKNQASYTTSWYAESIGFAYQLAIKIGAPSRKQDLKAKIPTKYSKNPLQTPQFTPQEPDHKLNIPQPARRGTAQQPTVNFRRRGSAK
jgi:hypothetical protein